MIDVSDLIGAPYKDGGRSKEEGFDCYGLAIEVCRRMGKVLPDLAYDDHSVELSCQYLPTLPLIPTDKASEGVILEMTILQELHIGVCLDKRYFIHATRNQGVRISKIGTVKIRGIYTWV